MSASFGLLTGRSGKHLAPLDDGRFLLHKQVLAPFQALRQSALKAGFKMHVTSSFRGHERQLGIWNAKAQGKRALLDAQGMPLDFGLLSPEEIVWSILRWSALPGASRHHWGTDMDVYDANALPSPDYQVQLTPQEVASGAPMGRFHDWLDGEIDAGRSFGLYRPYARDLGGVSPERWHLSYAPLSAELMERYTFEVFARNLEESELALKGTVLDHALRAYAEYVVNVEAAPF